MKKDRRGPKKMAKEENPFPELRTLAKKILELQPREVLKGTAGDITKLIEELKVHQIELEMQNLELRKSQARVKKTSEKIIRPLPLLPCRFFHL